jgi:hypothetical protein
MKYRLLTGFTVLLICGFGIFGRIKLATYTDITSDPSFVNEFSVAEIPTSIAITDCQALKEILPEAPIILKVTPIGTPEFFFQGWQQKVHIEQIFSGKGLKSDSDIYIFADSWNSYVVEKQMDLSFVNFMKDGEEYLIFSSGSIGYTKEGIEVFQLQKNQFIAPVFAYKNHNNAIYPVSGESTYVPYKAVSGNEFFAVDSEGLDAFLEIKDFFIQMYK